MTPTTVKPSLDETLNESLRNTVDSFFLSLQKGGTALTSFLGTWSTLYDTIRSHHDELHHETLVSIQGIASLVRTVSSNVLDLELSEAKMTEDSVTAVSKILEDEMGGLTIDDLPSTRTKASPAYLKIAYRWLLANLHNPYPSKDVKVSIAQETKCSLRDIDAWFTDVRKRIGWNKIRKTRFSNKQDKIIAASIRFFKPTSTPYSDNLDGSLIDELNLDDIYRSDFIIMEKKARSLYPGRFPASETSIPFDSLVSRSPATITKKEVDHEGSDPIQVGTLPYPTPEPSPGFFSPSSPLPPTPKSVPKSPQSNSTKRRHSDSDCAETDVNHRVQKRPRQEGLALLDDDVAGSMPSPSARAEISEEACTDSMVADVSEKPTLKRKRRLSDVSCQGPSKLPHNALRLPRLQTVSDPFPMTTPPLEDLFGDGWPQVNATFERQFSDVIPPPVNAEDRISLTEPLAVNFHQYNFSPYNHGAYLPTTVTNPGSANVETGALLPPDNSNSSFIFETLSFTNAVKDAGLDCIDPAKFQFDLIPAPSYQLDFEPCSTPDNLTVFENSELLSLTPGHMADPLSMTGDDAYFCLHDLDYVPGIFIKAPVLGNFNHSIPRALPISEEQEAKRARARALREELAIYEAEGL